MGSAMGVLPLLGVYLVAVISPGPDFLLITHNAAGSRRDGVAVAAGVVTGNAIYGSAAMLGVTVALIRFGWLLEVIRFAGAAFLVVVGVMLLLAARRAPRWAAVSDPVHAPARSLLAGWRIGVLGHLGNPKAIVFFGSLFTVLLPPELTMADKVGVLAAMVVTASSWWVFVVAVVSLPTMLVGYRRAARLIDAATGGLLVAVGIRMATTP